MSLVLIAGALFLVVLALRRHTPGAIVLGSELAEARARDERIRTGPSPMPSRSYTPRDASLVNPEEVPLDAEIREVVRRFAASDAAAREEMRLAISMDEFYTLSRYAEREAVFAIRDRSRERLVDAFTAIAMIDVTRIDWRDAGLFLRLPYHAARVSGIDPKALIAEAAASSTREMRATLEAFARQPESQKTLENMLLHEVETGFIARGIGDYKPTRDLASAAVKIYDLLDADRYPASSVEIASDFSDHWYPGARDAYRRIRAGAMLHGQLADVSDDEWQGVMVFLAETASPDDAQALAGALRVPNGARLAVARGNLAVSVVAQSELADHETVETDASLARFAEPLAKILEETR